MRPWKLLNALRRDGLLAATAAGWRWDEAAVRAHLGRSGVAGLLAASAAALPEQSRQMLEAMACLGGRAELSLLQAATGEPAGVVDQALAPALEEGLLVAEPGARPAVRFRHDRIREAILGGLEPQRRHALQLAMARRLAAVPELFAVAAEQYLPVVDGVADAAERRQVARLLRRAAGQATLTGDYALVHALLTAALAAVDPGDAATLAAVHTSRHAALHCLGRLEEADEEYRTIERLCPAVLDRADATAVQVRSVTHRTRFAEAVGLGLESLRELGIAVPAADQLAADLDHQFGYWYQWLDHTEAADDLARTDLTDPTLLAASGLISATLHAAYLAGDPATVTWLGVEALRICLEHGPAPALVGPVAYSAFGAVLLRGDYVAGYRAARRILALGEARGYEPGTSQARYLFAVLSGWAEPIENSVQAAQQAREELIAGGELADAGYSYYASVPGTLDCAPSGPLPGRGGSGGGLCAPYRQRAVRSGARPLPVAGRRAAWRKHGRSRRGGFRRQVRRQPAGTVSCPSQSCERCRHLRRSGRPGAAHRGRDDTSSGAPGPLPDRRRPPAARAGPGRAGPRRGRGQRAAPCCPNWTS